MPKRCLPHALSRVVIDDRLIKVTLYTLKAIIPVVCCIEYVGVKCGSAFGFVSWRWCLRKDEDASMSVGGIASGPHVG